MQCWQCAIKPPDLGRMMGVICPMIEEVVYPASIACSHFCIEKVDKRAPAFSERLMISKLMELHYKDAQPYVRAMIDALDNPDGSLQYIPKDCVVARLKGDWKPAEYERLMAQAAVDAFDDSQNGNISKAAAKYYGCLLHMCRISTRISRTGKGRREI